MDEVMVEPGCFLGLVASAIEAYNRETNGYLIGYPQGGPPRPVPQAPLPLGTEDRKPSGVEHGNARAFDRARRTMRGLESDLRRVGGFHSHTGDDGAAALSASGLEYIHQEVGWAH